MTDERDGRDERDERDGRDGRGAARLGRLARSPGWQLVAGAAVLALAFPAQLSGTLGLTVLAGALGVSVALAWPRVPACYRSPPAAVTTALVVAVVATAGVTTFWGALTESPDWQLGDWGPQRAVLAGVIDALPGLDAPVWNHAVGTGDAPLELYPRLTYLAVGHLALALGLADDLPLALMIAAVLVHVAIAIATTLLALRVAPWPLALVVGLLAVVDSGAVAHGGTVGLFRWALLHSALALAFATVAALGVLAALARPRTRAAVAIWLGTALACATHPAGLLAAVALIVGLAAVALLAADVPPRRALVAIGHVVLGVALAAAAWMPLAERLLAYGQHFPNPIRAPAALLEDLLAAPSPVTAFALLGYAGYLGILVGLWSRRAATVFVAAAALALLVGLCDAPYLAFELAPGQVVARLGTERLAQLARPFQAACAAYGLAILAGHAIAGWRGASPRARLAGAAILAILAGAAARSLPALWGSLAARAAGEARVLAPDPAGRAALTAWAAQRAAELRPDAWARAVFETDTHEHFHLTAETGLPSFHLSAQPDLLLRERIEDLGPASLRRFNVRWAIATDRSPALGDPATEQRFGSYHVRELGTWDGRFARVERGAGEVRVTRLDAGAVEIEVTAAAPVLVALGTGYYPRWRARHASGAAQRVVAVPTVPGGKLHVVGAWVAPGRTTFTCDGPLPSDGDGALISLAALALALAGAIAWSRRRVRARILRRLARLRARARARAVAGIAVKLGVPVALLALLVRGCADARGPARALRVGSGLRAAATVEARLAGEVEWRACGYERLAGGFRCRGLVTVHDAMASTLNDAPPSWAFSTPAIAATALRPGVELRVRLDARLDGRYWMAASDGEVTLAVEGERVRAIDRAILTYEDRGPRVVAIRAILPAGPWSFTFVHENTLIPNRQ